MSLVLYLDDCAYSRELRRLLSAAGYDTMVPAEVDPPLTGEDDEVHFQFARETGYALLTFNAHDFLRLHEATPDHAGIMVVPRQRFKSRYDPCRDRASDYQSGADGCHNRRRILESQCLSLAGALRQTITRNRRHVLPTSETW